jgi:hypothetical protein
MNRLFTAVALASLTVSGFAIAQQQNHAAPTTPGAGSSLTSGASTTLGGQHQQGQAFIEGTNGCQVSMWLDPAQIKSGSQQVQIHNCKQ